MINGEYDMVNKKGQGEIFALGVIVFIILMVVGVIGAFLGFDTVPASHLGVKEQFGTIRGVQHSGLEWTGLLTTVEKYDLRTNKVVVDMTGNNSAVDKTGQAIHSTINVNYRIKNSDDTVLRLYTEVGRSDVVADKLNLDAIISEGFKQATVKYEALEILDKRQEIKELAKKNIRNNFPTEYFELQKIIITNIDYSDEFKNAIEEKKVAEQDALKEKNQLEVVKYQQQQEIERYKAEAEKMRIQKSEVTALLNQQKWIEKWDGTLPTSLVMTGSSSDLILSLPTVDDTESSEEPV